MTAFKGTPGPWHLLVDGFIYAKDGGRVANPSPSPWPPLHKERSDEEIAANTHLIAAAPDLLSVAQDFDEWLLERGWHCECNHPDCRTFRLRTAIAKALGGGS